MYRFLEAAFNETLIQQNAVCSVAGQNVCKMKITKRRLSAGVLLWI